VSVKCGPKVVLFLCTGTLSAPAPFSTSSRSHSYLEIPGVDARRHFTPGIYILLERLRASKDRLIHEDFSWFITVFTPPNARPKEGQTATNPSDTGTCTPRPSKHWDLNRHIDLRVVLEWMTLPIAKDEKRWPERIEWKLESVPVTVAHLFSSYARVIDSTT
jgi:hypothetical protein